MARDGIWNRLFVQIWVPIDRRRIQLTAACLLATHTIIRSVLHQILYCAQHSEREYIGPSYDIVHFNVTELTSYSD